ncbi:CPBP family intramembrane metalloprotease [Clostridium botulinum]|nr:CPBP family intramembrane metalloprotease [Clostridium botulinum]
MEKEITEKKFNLSVLGALGIIVVYNMIIPFIVNIPFDFISQTIYVKSHKVLKLVIVVLADLIPNSIMIILLLKKIRKDYQASFKIKYIEKFNFKLLLCTVFLTLGLFLWFQSSIGIMIEKIPMPQSIENMFEEMFENFYVMIMCVIIIGPIFEEIFMRGIILEGFLNRYKPITAIFISALIFGLLHLNIPQFINATFIGIFFGVIYYKTRSLILCIIAHMSNNAIATFMGIIDIKRDIISFLVGIVIFIAAGLFFEIYIKKLKFTHVRFKNNGISLKK